MGKIVLISTTTESKKDAEDLARKLLERKLIACAQISGPISSHYRWKDELVSSDEYTLSVKTSEGKADQVQQTINTLHPYELPEIIGIQLAKASEEYVNWVEQELE